MISRFLLFRPHFEPRILPSPLRQRWNVQQQCQMRWLGDTSERNTDNKRKLYIRLYRILYRQVWELAKNQKEGGRILLHPIPDIRLMGHDRIFRNTLTIDDRHHRHQQQQQVDSSSEAIWRLFHRWEQQNLTQLKRKRDDGPDEKKQEVRSVVGGNNTNSSLSNTTLDDEDRFRQLTIWVESMIHATTPQQGQTINYPKDKRSEDTLWTTPSCLFRAIRLAFSTPPLPLLPHNYFVDWSLCAYRYLKQQVELSKVTVSKITTTEIVPQQQVSPSPSQSDETVYSSATPAPKHGPRVRVTAVARCFGSTLSLNSVQTYSSIAPEPRYRFVYRLRIENCGFDEDGEDHPWAIQLLGRSWIIHEEPTNHANSSSSSSPPMKVHAPTTGAVGKHAVLLPGQVLEYYSGCDLATPRGRMEGTFYFALVPPETKSASVGEYVPALDQEELYPRFEIPVPPFPLHQDS